MQFESVLNVINTVKFTRLQPYSDDADHYIFTPESGVEYTYVTHCNENILLLRKDGKVDRFVGDQLELPDSDIKFTQIQGYEMMIGMDTIPLLKQYNTFVYYNIFWV